MFAVSPLVSSNSQENGLKVEKIEMPWKATTTNEQKNMVQVAYQRTTLSWKSLITRIAIVPEAEATAESRRRKYMSWVTNEFVDKLPVFSPSYAPKSTVSTHKSYSPIIPISNGRKVSLSKTAAMTTVK